MKITKKELEKLKRFFPHAERAVLGEGPVRTKLMFIGEAPGKKEDATGRPFVGRAGKFFDKVLSEISIERKKCFVTSVVKFLPAKRTPNKKEIELCLPITHEQIRAIKPKVVCLLGNVALNSLLDAKAKVSRVHGRIFIRGGIKWIPTFHPAAAMRNRKLAKLVRGDLGRVKRLI